MLLLAIPHRYSHLYASMPWSSIFFESCFVLALVVLALVVVVVVHDELANTTETLHSKGKLLVQEIRTIIIVNTNTLLV